MVYVVPNLSLDVMGFHPFFGVTSVYIRNTDTSQQHSAADMYTAADMLATGLQFSACSRLGAMLLR